MADKPKTYAQQVQELKDQLAAKDDELLELRAKATLLSPLEREIEKLRADLAAKSKEDQQNLAGSKAQWTDLLQRAESAEQGLRNAQALIKELEAHKQAMESQLNVQAIERDRVASKSSKLLALTEDIKSERLEFARSSQRKDEMIRDQATRIASLENTANYHRAEAAKLNDELETLKQIIRGATDPIAALKNMI